MDRAAAKAPVLGSKRHWLAAVLMVLKMQGADTELHCDVKEIMRPLMLGWHQDPPNSKQEHEQLQLFWEEILVAEQKLFMLLNFEVLVPTPLDLLKALLGIVFAAGRDEWAEGHVKVARSHPLADKEPKDVALTRLEALAFLLLELGLLLQPQEAFAGKAGGAQLLAFAAFWTAHHAISRETSSSPSETCKQTLMRAQGLLLTTKAEVAELGKLMKSLQQLWAKVDKRSCSTTKKWTHRSTGLGGDLPKPFVAKPAESTLGSQQLVTDQMPHVETPPRRPSFLMGASATPSPPLQDQVKEAVLPGSRTHPCRLFVKQIDGAAVPEQLTSLLKRAQLSAAPSVASGRVEKLPRTARNLMQTPRPSQEVKEALMKICHCANAQPVRLQRVLSRCRSEPPENGMPTKRARTSDWAPPTNSNRTSEFLTEDQRATLLRGLTARSRTSL